VLRTTRQGLTHCPAFRARLANMLSFVTFAAATRNGVL
jgi:hypothetical protein